MTSESLTRAQHASRMKERIWLLILSSCVIVILLGVMAMARTWSSGNVAIQGQYADANAIDLGNGTYRMYYDIRPKTPDDIAQSFSAISTDGAHWKQEPGIRKSPAGAPYVIRLPDGTFRMYFQDQGVIKSAVSTDGLNWTDEPGVRMDTGNEVGLTLDSVSCPAVDQLSNGSYLMVYSAAINPKHPLQSISDTNSDTTLLMWAVSSDGLNFDRKGIAVDSRTDTFKDYTSGADLIKWSDGNERLFFWSRQGIYSTRFMDNAFIDPILVFNKGSTGPAGIVTPTDPTLIRIGIKWFMYYGQSGKGIYYATLGK